MTDGTLDLTGLQCPLPILKAKKAIAPLAPGTVIEVLVTDPGAPDDFATWCDLSGHALLESDENAGVFRFRIRKAGA